MATLVDSKQPPPPPSQDGQFVPLKHVLDRWLVSADYISREGSDLYHANLAALAALKDVYLFNDPNWLPLRDSVYVGVIKDTRDCGTSSVSMGVAAEYFAKDPFKNNVLILNCGTGGTKYGLYTQNPCIHEIFKKETGSKDGQISCIKLAGCTYHPRAYGLPFTVQIDDIEESLRLEKKEVIDELVRKNLCTPDVEAIAFITGSIRDFYSRKPDEQAVLDQGITGMFKNIGVNEVPDQKGPSGNPTYFLSQVREGVLELKAVQTMHKNLANNKVINPKYVPVVSLGIGRGTAQFAMDGEIISHEAGMNKVYEMSKLGQRVIQNLRGVTLKLFLRKVKAEIDAGNFPVIALKSGCTLAFDNKNVFNGNQLKKNFLSKVPVPSISVDQQNVSPRLFLAQNGNVDTERVAWRKPHSITTIDALCAHASVVLRSDANYIAVYHENGSRLREIGDIGPDDLLFFSQGEPFGAPPGLPTTAPQKGGLTLVPLSWIPDRWLLGHDADHELDDADERCTHATLATLKELWYYGSAEWNEVREKVHVCFEDDLAAFLEETSIRKDLADKLDDIPDAKEKEKLVADEKKERQKFVASNRSQKFDIDANQNIVFFNFTFPYEDFAKEFAERLRGDRSDFFEQLLLKMHGAKFPFIILTKRALPLIEPLPNADFPAMRKRNEFRLQLRSQFILPLKEPSVAPPSIRVYFGLNTEKDGNAFRVSPNWTLSRVCAEAVQVLCPGTSGMLFTRVFNRMGFEINPVNALSPIGMKDEDTLFFSFGEDFGEDVSGAPAKCTIPAIPLFSLRKLADIDVASGRIKVVFDFTLLVPREGVPKEVRRDGFLVNPIRVTLNSEEFFLDNPTSVILSSKSASSFAHIVPPGVDKGLQFYKWKARPTINMCLNSCDDELHRAIRECPFDVHILHFVIELKTVRTRGYKVAFDMHLMKRGCVVRDKEKVDYLPEFDIDWETSRIELATNVPVGIEKDKWTESLQTQQNLLCVGQEEFMTGVTRGNEKEKDPKWLDDVKKTASPAYFQVGIGCDCVFRDFTAEEKLKGKSEGADEKEQNSETKVEGKLDPEAKTAKTLTPSFSNFVSCPRKVIYELGDSNDYCNLQKERKLLHTPDGAFSVLHYSLLIRRDPTLLTLLAVFPVFLLCLLALAIVWQSSGFTDSVANIAAVLLALFAYSPVVRSRLPPSPSITAIDKLLNYAIVVCFTVLLTAVVKEGYRQQHEVDDDNMDSVIVDGVVAKIYLAHVSLVASIIIIIGHTFVFCYFLYQICRHVIASRRQSLYVQNLDAEASKKEETPKEETQAGNALGQRNRSSIQMSSYVQQNSL